MDKVTKPGFNELVEDFHNSLIQYIRDWIFAIKKNNGLNNKELSALLNIGENDLESLLYKGVYKSGVDSKLISILYLLTNESFILSNTGFTTPNNMNDIIKNHLDTISLDIHNKNIAELLEVLGIETESDLEEVIADFKLLNKVTKEEFINAKKESY